MSSNAPGLAAEVLATRTLCHTCGCSAATPNRSACQLCKHDHMAHHGRYADHEWDQIAPILLKHTSAARPLVIAAERAFTRLVEEWPRYVPLHKKKEGEASAGSASASASAAAAAGGGDAPVSEAAKVVLARDHSVSAAQQFVFEKDGTLLLSPQDAYRRAIMYTLARRFNLRWERAGAVMRWVQRLDCPCCGPTDEQVPHYATRFVPLDDARVPFIKLRTFWGANSLRVLWEADGQAMMRGGGVGMDDQVAERRALVERARTLPVPEHGGPLDWDDLEPPAAEEDSAAGGGRGRSSGGAGALDVGAAAAAAAATGGTGRRPSFAFAPVAGTTLGATSSASSSSTTTTDLSAVPADVLVRVFDFLPPLFVIQKCALVCRSWRDASRHDGVWMRVSRAVAPRSSSYHAQQAAAERTTESIAAAVGDAPTPRRLSGAGEVPDRARAAALGSMKAGLAPDHHADQTFSWDYSTVYGVGGFSSIRMWVLDAVANNVAGIRGSAGVGLSASALSSRARRTLRRALLLEALRAADAPDWRFRFVPSSTYVLREGSSTVVAAVEDVLACTAPPVAAGAEHDPLAERSLVHVMVRRSDAPADAPFVGAAVPADPDSPVLLPTLNALAAVLAAPDAGDDAVDDDDSDDDAAEGAAAKDSDLAPPKPAPTIPPAKAVSILEAGAEDTTEGTAVTKPAQLKDGMYLRVVM